MKGFAVAYCENDAKAVLSKHQRKVTSHRVDVLLFLMRHKKAFTFNQVTQHFINKIDRATVYRILGQLEACDIIRKVMNADGHACYFYSDHAPEVVPSYLECVDCDRVFSLPAPPEQYLELLGSYQTAPISTLLRGNCNRQDCCTEH